MIKFFRRIRQRLLDEGNLKRYFIYAIGEILLVVIGIVIALSISKWNSDVNDKETEQRLLYELSQGIKNDKLLIENELFKTNNAISNLNKLDSLLKYDIPKPNEDLNHLFGTVYGMKHLRLNLALYENLKSVGLGIVEDEKLRAQIIRVFEYHYAQIGGILDVESDINQVIRPYYLSNFISIKFSEYAIPIDIEKLWIDSYYKNIIYYRIETLEVNQKVFYKNSITNINLLLKLIDNSLKKE